MWCKGWGDAQRIRSLRSRPALPCHVCVPALLTALPSTLATRRCHSSVRHSTLQDGIARQGGPGQAGPFGSSAEEGQQAAGQGSKRHKSEQQAHQQPEQQRQRQDQGPAAAKPTGAARRKGPNPQRCEQPRQEPAASSVVATGRAPAVKEEEAPPPPGSLAALLDAALGQPAGLSAGVSAELVAAVRLSALPAGQVGWRGETWRGVVRRVVSWRGDKRLPPVCLPLFCVQQSLTRRGVPCRALAGGPLLQAAAARRVRHRC